jgi:hypothetical protein
MVLPPKGHSSTTIFDCHNWEDVTGIKGTENRGYARHWWLVSNPNMRSIRAPITKNYLVRKGGSDFEKPYTSCP